MLFRSNFSVDFDFFIALPQGKKTVDKRQLRNKRKSSSVKYLQKANKGVLRFRTPKYTLQTRIHTRGTDSIMNFIVVNIGVIPIINLYKGE